MVKIQGKRERSSRRRQKLVVMKLMLNIQGWGQKRFEILSRGIGGFYVCFDGSIVN